MSRKLTRAENPRVLPIFQWPLDMVSRLLAFLFLYSSGMAELKEGFQSERRATTVKSLLVCYIIASSIQLIPAFMFDTYYHFGALWNFFLPVFLFVTPSKDKPKETIAVMICDTFFSQIASAINGIIPSGLNVSPTI